MAISNAVTLANIASQDTLVVDSANNRVGVASTTPTTALDVNGTATATSFVGNLTGDATGLTGTPNIVVGSVQGTTGSFSGVVTATTFDGNATTATTATNASGLTGTPDIVVGSVTGTTGSFSGDVSIGGTLTYEDVTNVDSIGVITARSGINVTAGGADLKGVLQEKVNITAGKLSDNTNINLTNGMVHYFTTTETTTSTPNIMSTVGINTEMATGDTIAVTIITTAAAAGYSTSVNIDGNYNDVKWIGGSDPTTGGDGGLDIYAFNIIKTGSAAYTVIGNLSNAA